MKKIGLHHASSTTFLSGKDCQLRHSMYPISFVHRPLPLVAVDKNLHGCEIKSASGLGTKLALYVEKGIISCARAK